MKVGLNSSEIGLSNTALPIIRVGDFNLDLERGLLRSGANDIALRAKSFDVLTHLVRNAGRVVSKDELLNEVWGEVNVSEDSLSQCIHDIRSVLKDTAHVLLKTVPRRGYLVPDNCISLQQRMTGSVVTDHRRFTDASWLNWPRISVQPFFPSGDIDENRSFAGGLVDSLIFGLHRTRRLFVVTQSALEKTNVVTITQGTDCEVAEGRYILEGNVRQSIECLRIVSRLIDAKSGAVLWAERFDSAPGEKFQLQDELAKAIVGAVVPQIRSAEVDRVQRFRPHELGAYDLYLQAIAKVGEMTSDGNEAALLCCTQALDRDPDFAAAAGLAAWIYSLRVPQGWQVSPTNERRMAINFARRAVRIGAVQEDSEALAYGGYVIAFLAEELEEGLGFLELAIEICPGNAQAVAFSGWVRCYLGDATAAERDFNAALRLSPRDPSNFRTFAGLSFANLMNGKLEDAVICGNTALKLNPNYTPTHRALASALGHLGRKAEAKRTLELLLEQLPRLTLSQFAQQTLFRYSGKLDFILDGLRKAGLNE